MRSAHAMLIVFSVAGVVTALLIPIVQYISTRLGLYAPIKERSVHTKPISQLGGVAIFGGFVTALVVSWAFTNSTDLLRDQYENLRLVLLLVGAAMLWVVSIMDDIWDLPPLPRLIWQFLCALVAVGPYLWEQQLYGPKDQARGIIFTAFNNPFGGQINFHEISPWLAIIVTLVWVVGMTNIVNMIDGLDGLAGGVTLIAATILAIHTFRLNQYTVVLLPLAIAGACCGFLPYNFHPARIIMGDSGAMVLGYLLGITAIIGGAKLASALLVFGVPIVDGIWIVIYRWLTGGHSMHADRRHLHYQLLALGLSQRQIVSLYYAMTALFGAVALFVPDGNPQFKLWALALLALLLAGVLTYVTREGLRRARIGR